MYGHVPFFSHLCLFSWTVHIHGRSLRFRDKRVKVMVLFLVFESQLKFLGRLVEYVVPGCQC